jgi:ribosomal-protein-alanine N-acetyltransferase
MEEIEIGPLATDDEARACAAMMSTTDPWITIGRTFEECLEIVREPAREVCVARRSGGEVRGFVIINMGGAFIGYIQILCVAVDARGTGLGTQLIRFSEERILRETPNVFICASSFNPRARALYERLGYEPVGMLKDYVIRGESELLLRKTIMSLREWQLSHDPSPGLRPPSPR